VVEWGSTYARGEGHACRASELKLEHQFRKVTTCVGVVTLPRIKFLTPETQRKLRTDVDPQRSSIRNRSVHTFKLDIIALGSHVEQGPLQSLPPFPPLANEGI
jgi:hypothetical protein